VRYGSALIREYVGFTRLDRILHHVLRHRKAIAIRILAIVLGCYRDRLLCKILIRLAIAITWDWKDKRMGRDAAVASTVSFTSESPIPARHQVEQCPILEQSQKYCCTMLAGAHNHGHNSKPNCNTPPITPIYKAPNDAVPKPNSHLPMEICAQI